MSDTPNNPLMPPVPRDAEEASFSELVPFRSSKIRLARSPLFLLALFTAIVTPFMFGLLGPALQGQDVNTKISAMVTANIVAVFFLVALVQILVFLYVRADRPLWVYFIPFAVVALILFTPLSAPFFIVFREILPGKIEPGQVFPFPQQFIKMFFAAGLMEELMKAVPILLGAWLMIRANKNPHLPQGGLQKALHVRGPLDGALMGIFAGGGFIFVETAFQYVPGTVRGVLQQTNDPGTAMAAGLLLLLPRVFGGIVGHMAYSGLFGYFIGLAVIRPKQMWKLIGIGWLASSLIHALWNSVPVISPMLSYVVAIGAAVGLVGAILKARQLQLSSAGGAGNGDTFGSIVVERGAARQAAPQPPAMPAPTTAAPAEILALNVEGLMIPLRGGEGVDLGAEPALGGRGAGVAGLVVPHPTRANVLGLRNTGTAAWTARLRDGSRQMIERDQNIRLAGGVQIEFGGGLTGSIVKLG